MFVKLLYVPDKCYIMSLVIKTYYMLTSIVCMVIMAPFVLLLVFTATCAIVTAEGNDSHSCPLWHYRHNGECKCGYNAHGAILCSEDQVYLRVDYTMDILYNVTVVVMSSYAYHNYSAIPRHLRVYSPIPNSTSQQDLMCKSNNRKGFMCGKCLLNYGPSAYSPKCHKCDIPVTLAIALYITVKLLPVAILFIVITTFHINIMKGPMLGYILFCQIYVISAHKMPAIYETIVHHLNSVLADIFLFLSTIWSLDFLPVTRIFPPFCISHKLWNMDIRLLNYISVLSPVFLLVASCIFMELYARGFKVIVYCWKPFHPCFVRIRRNWSSSDSIIHAFASLMFLSFASLNYNTFHLLSSTNIYNANSTHPFRTNVLVNYPKIHMYEPKYIYYPLIAFVLLFFLGILPSLLLLLYPIRMFRVRLQRCCSHRWLIRLNTFVETFQGPFKDGCNGTRDFRIFPGVICCLALFATILSCFSNGSECEHYLKPTFVVSLVLLSVVSAYTKPCKSSTANLSLTFHFMLMAVGSGLVTLWMQALNMNTSVLASLFVIVLALPHMMMFLWVCFKIQKKFRLQQRSAVCINSMMGRVIFQTVKLVHTPQLPDRLINSQEYRELT